MNTIRFKKGKKGFPLTEEQKQELLNILRINKYTLPEMAASIRLSNGKPLSLIQLRKPLCDGGNCSRESLLAIERFLARQEKKAKQG